jgi:hypothetical protein
MSINRIFQLAVAWACLCFCPIVLSEEAAQSDKEVIAILGTGDMGDSFGPRLAKLGYKIIYGSRSPRSERVMALVEKTGNGASAMTSDMAARSADIVFLAIPWEPMEQVIKSLGDMEGKTIIDLSWERPVPMSSTIQMTLAGWLQFPSLRIIAWRKKLQLELLLNWDLIQLMQVLSAWRAI